MEEIAFSKEIIKANNIFIAALVLVSVPFIFLSDLILSDWEIKESLFTVGITYLFISGLLGIQMILIDRKQLRTRLQLLEDGIIKLEGNKENKLKWKEITEVRILKYKKNEEPHKIIVVSNRKRRLVLYGFKKMSNFIPFIKEKVPATVSWETKHLILDKKSVILLFGLSWLVIITLVYLFRNFSILR